MGTPFTPFLARRLAPRCHPPAGGPRCLILLGPPWRRPFRKPDKRDKPPSKSPALYPEPPRDNQRGRERPHGFFGALPFPRSRCGPPLAAHQQVPHARLRLLTVTRQLSARSNRALGDNLSYSRPPGQLACTCKTLCAGIPASNRTHALLAHWPPRPASACMPDALPSSSSPTTCTCKSRALAITARMHYSCTGPPGQQARACQMSCPPSLQLDKPRLKTPTYHAQRHPKPARASTCNFSLSPLLSQQPGLQGYTAPSPSHPPSCEPTPPLLTPPRTAETARLNESPRSHPLPGLQGDTAAHPSPGQPRPPQASTADKLHQPYLP